MPKSMIVWIFLLILTPSLRQKTTIFMMKSYFLQVNPVYILRSYWCGLLSYIILGISTIVQFA
jgi:hypothetical protein